MRTSDVRKVCQEAGYIWHFNAEGKFGSIEMGLDKKQDLTGLQCGKRARAHRILPVLLELTPLCLDLRT
jgi:hypothetical protein